MVPFLYSTTLVKQVELKYLAVKNLAVKQHIISGTVK